MESVLFNVFLHVISPTSWIVLIPNRHFFPVCQMAEPTPPEIFWQGSESGGLAFGVFVIPTEESNFLGACTVYYCFVSWYTYTLAKRKTLVSRWFLVGLLLLGFVDTSLDWFWEKSQIFPDISQEDMEGNSSNIGSTLVDCGKAPFITVEGL